MSRLGVVIMLLTACSGVAETPDGGSSSVPTLGPPGFLETDEPPPPPARDADRVLAGEILYQQHCSECHKPDLSGEPDWMIPKDDGTYKPPPQDSTGHTWHHADQLLLEIIRDGNVNPITVMPLFGGILADNQILDILEFFKSQWGDAERTLQWEVTWRAEQGEG